MVNASYATPENIRYRKLESTFFSSPVMTYTELPKDEDQLIHLMIGVDLYGEPDLDRRAEFYKPHSQAIDSILSKQLDKKILFNSQSSKKKLNKFLKKKGENVSDYAFFPISGNNKKEVVFVINKYNGLAVGTIDINSSLSIKK